MDVAQLSQFPLPKGALEDMQRRGIRADQIADGVTKFTLGHDGGVSYRFAEEGFYNEEKSNELGYEHFDKEEVIYWRISKKNEIPARVSELPAELLRFNRRGELVGGRYAESYRRWKEGLEVQGLSIEKWNVLPIHHVRTLMAEGVYTVEQFAAWPETRVQDVFPESIVQHHKRAIQHVRSQDAENMNRETGDKLMEVLKENEKLQSQYEEMQKQMAELLAAKGAAKAEDSQPAKEEKSEAPRRRGRPRKVKQNGDKE